VVFVDESAVQAPAEERRARTRTIIETDASGSQSFVDRDVPEPLTATVSQPEAGGVQALLDQVEVMDVAGTWSATERVPDVVDPPVAVGEPGRVQRLERAAFSAAQPRPGVLAQRRPTSR
jgi:hypothetical protein